jgi:hypothetical protein
MQRFLREGHNWESHLSNSQQVILREVNRVQPKTIAILGSGWLLDVPLKPLTEQNAQIYLFDIAHPKKVLNRFRRVESVHFVNIDLTFGAIDRVTGFAKNPSDFGYGALLKGIRSISSQPFSTFDLVISVNTLSQLHAPLTGLFEAKGSMGKYNFPELIETIQTLHIQSLPHGRSLLITETDEELLNEKHKAVSISPRVFTHVSEFEMLQEWEWLFDTHSTYIDDYIIRKRVGAYRL